MPYISIFFSFEFRLITSFSICIISYLFSHYFIFVLFSSFLFLFTSFSICIVSYFVFLFSDHLIFIILLFLYFFSHHFIFVLFSFFLFPFKLFSICIVSYFLFIFFRSFDICICIICLIRVYCSIGGFVPFYIVFNKWRQRCTRYSLHTKCDDHRKI